MAEQNKHFITMALSMIAIISRNGNFDVENSIQLDMPERYFFNFKNNLKKNGSTLHEM